MWYVGYLLINKEDIHNTLDIDSDEYNDLMSVESEFNKLNLTENQLINFNLYLNGTVRNSTCNSFNNVCKKISRKLGGVFTDEGYMKYMVDKYNLSDIQTNILCTSY